MSRGVLRPGIDAFQQVYGGLKNRITAFAALPFDQLNRMALQRHVDQIASLETEI